MQVAMDMLQTLVRASGAAASGGGASSSAAPVSDALINHAFAACVHCTLRADDQATMQNGGECVRAYVAVALEQVLQWHDGQGKCAGAPPSNPHTSLASRAAPLPPLAPSFLSLRGHPLYTVYSPAKNNKHHLNAHALLMANIQL